MVDHESLIELNDHLRNHVQHLLQTHELYQIQWESRLNNAVARCRKEIWIAIVYVDFQIMRLKIEIYDELAWNIRWLNESVIFWDQSWTSLDYWRIFEDSVRVQVQWILWHSKNMYIFLLRRWLWRFLDKFCDSTQDLFKHTKPLSTWINRYVHPGVS